MLLSGYAVALYAGTIFLCLANLTEVLAITSSRIATPNCQGPKIVEQYYNWTRTSTCILILYDTCTIRYDFMVGCKHVAVAHSTLRLPDTMLYVAVPLRNLMHQLRNALSELRTMVHVLSKCEYNIHIWLTTEGQLAQLYGNNFSTKIGFLGLQ